MRVSVEEAVAEDHRHPGVGHPVRELASLLGRARVEIQVGELRSLQELERQHPRRRVAPDHLRHGDLRRVAEVAPEGLGVAGLVLVVELLADRAAELVDECLGVDEVERTNALAHDARRRAHQLQVRLDLPRGLRPLHLHDDLVACRQRRAVHLADRGSRDRRLVEGEERLLDREPELLLDHPAHVRERKRRHVVLQPAELGDDVGRHHVRPRREELAELDERRPELVEHLPQPPAAVGELRVVVARAAGRSGSRSRGASRRGRSRRAGRFSAAGAPGLGIIVSPEAAVGGRPARRLLEQAHAGARAVRPEARDPPTSSRRTSPSRCRAISDASDGSAPILSASARQLATASRTAPASRRGRYRPAGRDRRSRLRPPLRSATIQPSPASSSCSSERGSVRAVRLHGARSCTPSGRGVGVSGRGRAGGSSGGRGGDRARPSSPAPAGATAAGGGIGGQELLGLRDERRRLDDERAADRLHARPRPRACAAQTPAPAP